MRGWFSRTGSEALGWFLVALGALLWPLPGPGTIIVAGGIALLARHYSWARRIRDPFKRSAVRAAKYGVATWPRVFLSFLGGVWLVVLGVVWWMSPEIPEFDVLGVGFGPRLPASGWGTALGFFASAVAAWALLAYSVVRWKEPNDPQGSAEVAR